MSEARILDPDTTPAPLTGVTTRVWDARCGLPLVVEPETGEPDLAEWLEGNREAVLTARREHGAVLFRGFHVPEAKHFEAAAKVIDPDLKDEYLGISPRRKLTDYVFTSVELPPHYPIPQHAEMSFYYDTAPIRRFATMTRPASEPGTTTPRSCIWRRRRTN